eukprot:SAG22_NODE_335_length_12071_cov_5.268771_9_plen_1174_part_00
MLDTPPPSFVTGSPTAQNCAHGQPRRFIYFHGTEDTVCPYLGDCSPSDWYEPPREECAQRWGRHNQCTVGSGYDWQEEQLTELAFRYSWPSACPSDSAGETVFYKIRDFGHEWPGALGESRSGIDASEIMWAFFGLGGGRGGGGVGVGGGTGNATAVGFKTDDSSIAPAPIAATRRETLNFDFSWRFQRAAEPRYEKCTFEPNVTYGTGDIWYGQTASKEECCNECSNRETCRSWYWNGRTCVAKDNSVGKKAAPGPNRWSGRLGAPWPATMPATVPAPASEDYRDNNWAVVDAPHDYGRSRMVHCQATGRRRRLEQGGELPPASDNGTSIDFVNNCSGWYRKHFSLPAEWRKGVTWVYFEGVHHYSIAWLNGRQLGARHINGYTSFWHRLDNHGARFGDGEAGHNVLAIFANSDPGSGMYGYHGGGLTRHQYLVHADSVFLPPEQAWVHTSMGSNSSIVAAGDTPAHGLNATGVTITTEGLVSNAGDQPTKVWVVVEIIERSASVVVATGVAGSLTVPPNGNTSFETRISPREAVQLWSVARPVLHTARITVRVGGTDGPALDSQNVTFGARDVRFDANAGFFLNRQHVKLRGFCDFGPFGAVGAATPDRVHLYRAQLLRSVGANSWRMAHNPPAPGRLDVMDRLGMLALDENHYYPGPGYGAHMHPYGTYSPEVLAQTAVDMGDLVRRDRSHPSIFAWNLCNEVMCNDNATMAAAMRNATTKVDGTRPITMNHIVSAQGALPYLDVQGMSHRSGGHMDSFHAANPAKPILSTEAAICKTERGVDFDYCPRPAEATKSTSTCLYNNEESACIAVALSYSESRDFNAGTFLWAGFDHGSGSSGASGLIADWAGMKKPLAWWFRSWWLSNTSDADAGRPALWPEAAASSGGRTTLYIVDSWTPPPTQGRNRTIHVYTNAPLVRLYLNNRQIATSTAVPHFGTATFANLTYEHGNLTAEALSGSGDRLATDTALSSGSAVQIRLSLDAPSRESGTGTVLVADGQDVALVRAELLDSDGRLVSPRDNSTNAAVTFSVLSGGGRILGTISGSPWNQPLDEPSLDQTGSTAPAHYGLLRAFVQSTHRCIGTKAERVRLKQVHLDAGRDGSSQIDDASCNHSPADIVVRAQAVGMPATTLHIPMTHDVASLPMAVAEQLPPGGSAAEQVPQQLVPARAS